MDKEYFDTGDKVRVINYGHIMWMNTKLTDYYNDFTPIKEDGDIKWYDVMPELIGKEGVIEKGICKQGKHQYSLQGVKGKVAWYSNDQLELINKNPNTI